MKQKKRKLGMYCIQGQVVQQAIKTAIEPQLWEKKPFKSQVTVTALTKVRNELSNGSYTI